MTSLPTTSNHAANGARPAHPYEPRIDLRNIRFSRRWLAAGVVLGPLALLGARRGGPAAAALGLAAAATAAYAGLVEPIQPILEQITLRVPELPAALEGLRIGQLSDLHLGMLYSAHNTRWAVAQLMRAQPDLLVLTGDFVNYDHAIPSLPSLLEGLRAPLGTYAVPGNHDYHEGIDSITARLSELGVEMLLNTHRVLRWRGGELWLAGVDDIWEGEADLDAALAGIPDGACTVLLCHAPDFADEAARRKIAVQLSGHTHGGHLRLPLLGPFCLPRYGLRYACGLEQVGDTLVYVSRGVGGLPLRFGCSPEATIFTLTRA